MRRPALSLNFPDRGVHGRWAAWRRLAGAVLLVVAISSCTPDAVEDTADPSSGEDGAEAWSVTDVVDGDTIEVAVPDGGQERVRVIGIDTPEQGECGFDRATDKMEELVGDEQVDLVAGARDDRDRYDRLLRYVDVDDTDAGLALIRDGLAIARYDSRDGYGPHPREDEYIAADEATDHVCPRDGEAASESE